MAILAMLILVCLFVKHSLEWVLNVETSGIRVKTSDFLFSDEKIFLVCVTFELKTS